MSRLAGSKRLVVTVLEPGDTVPGSILGLCRLLETKVNLAMQQVLPGAAIRCAPAGPGRGIRVNAFFSPAQSLARCRQPSRLKKETWTPPPTQDDADTFLLLSTAEANVGALLARPSGR